MTRSTIALLSLVFAVTLTGLIGPVRPAAAQSWQYSFQPSNQIGPQFQIGIRSKFGETTYWATFIVSAPGGRAYSRTIRVRADNWGYLTYPRDFRAPAQAGAYRYVIVVGGKIAIRAKFKLR